MNQELINTVLNRHHLKESFLKLSSELNTSELTTFLSYVMATRAESLNAASLRKSMSTDRFVKPSTVSPKTFHQFDAKAFDLLHPAYEIIELSPLAPLGAVSALAAVDPGLVVHTVRSHEVLSDCTNVLALIAATRRHEKPGKDRPEMNLCASHRLVRAQYPLHEKHTAHFKILTIVSAGRDSGSFSFELRKLAEHMRYYVTLIRSFQTTEHAKIDIVLKEYADTGVNWQEFSKLIESHNTLFTYQRIERENWSYYSPVQFQLNIRQGDDTFNLADGGMVDWTQIVLSDKKERLLISGFGTELFCKLFMER